MTQLKGRTGVLRWILSLAVLAILAAGMSPLMTADDVLAEADEPTKAWKDISLIYSTDVKGKIEPCGWKSKPRGGLARRASFLDNIWNENVPFLMVDAGDLFGRRSKDERHQTEFLCEMTGDLGYDGIGLGERDLNYGLPFLLEMVEKYSLPFTNANVHDVATGDLILPEYLVVERNGIKYGLVSVLDPALKIITMTADEANFTVADPVATLRDLLPRIRQEVDCIVLLGHMGENNTEPVLKEVKGIDISVKIGRAHVW